VSQKRYSGAKAISNCGVITRVSGRHGIDLKNPPKPFQKAAKYKDFDVYFEPPISKSLQKPITLNTQF